ncbi:MAG TPA: hypothetical protein DIW23_07710 [Anaerolineae bacterium]|nr:hypothetical protein [Anaerolineae bacterium]HRJ75161.1 hypothetical protein [Anaerolineales bacterium]
MTIPSLILGLIIALLAATIFHAIRGGNGWRLLLFIGLSVAGFFLVEWAGGLIGWGLYAFGALDAGLGVVGSVLFLLIGDWLIRR